MLEKFIAECVPETDSARKFKSLSLGMSMIFTLGHYLSISNYRFCEVVLWFLSSGSFVHIKKNNLQAYLEKKLSLRSRFHKQS